MKAVDNTPEKKEESKVDVKDEETETKEHGKHHGKGHKGHHKGRHGHRGRYKKGGTSTCMAKVMNVLFAILLILHFVFQYLQYKAHVKFQEVAGKSYWSATCKWSCGGWGNWKGKTDKKEETKVSQAPAPVQVVHVPVVAQPAPEIQKSNMGANAVFEYNISESSRPSTAPLN